MNALTSVMSEIFDRKAERRFESSQEERDAILAAKGGDDAAMVALMYAYAPAIRGAVSKFTGVETTASAREELRSSAVLGFVQAVNSYDPATSDRLAGIVKAVLSRTLRDEYGTSTAFSVPPRTLTRFYAILDLAEGNVYDAAALAPSYEMKRETFLAVLSAVRHVSRLDAPLQRQEGGDAPSLEDQAAPLWDSSLSEEDAELVAAAFLAVSAQEKTVCRLAYGFETHGDPLVDEEVAERLGFSRPTAQRVRASGLGKMRVALAVA